MKWNIAVRIGLILSLRCAVAVCEQSGQDGWGHDPGASNNSWDQSWEEAPQEETLAGTIGFRVRETAGGGKMQYLLIVKKLGQVNLHFDANPHLKWGEFVTVTGFWLVDGSFAVKSWQTSNRRSSRDASVREETDSEEDTTQDTTQDVDKFEFAPISVVPSIGLVVFPRHRIKSAKRRYQIAPRLGFMAKIHLSLGAQGLSLEFAPLYAFVSSPSPKTDLRVDSEGMVRGVVAEKYSAFGGQLGVVSRFSVKRVYLSVGIGVHGAMLKGLNNFLGVELYGRIPANLTWYFKKYLGFDMSFSFMYGIMGFRKIPIKYENEGLDAVIELIDRNLSKAFHSAHGMGLELLVGLRFP